MLDEYRTYLLKGRGLEEATVEGYISDISDFKDFLRGKDLRKASKSDIYLYIIDLKKGNYRDSTISRRVSSLKSFYNYFLNMGKINLNPTFDLDFKADKTRKPKLETINLEELFMAPYKYSQGMIRYMDSILLKLIYYSNIELKSIPLMKKEILDLDLGTITLNGSLHYLNIKLVEEFKLYLDLIEKFDTDYLFLNYKGQALSRQSVWSLVKKYGSCIGVDITPQTLINISKEM